MVFGPLAQLATTVILGWVFAPRTEGEARGGLEPLSTSPLDELARSAPASEAPSTTATATAPIERRVSADGNTAYLTESEIERLLAPAPSSATSSSSPAPSSAAPAPLDERESIAREALARELLAPAPVTPAQDTPVLSGEVIDSPGTAARKLYTLATTTTSRQRDTQRAFIRAMQAAMGGITADGLIGRATAARIRELTGLRIPGLS